MNSFSNAMAALTLVAAITGGALSSPTNCPNGNCAVANVPDGFGSLPPSNTIAASDQAGAVAPSVSIDDPGLSIEPPETVVPSTVFESPIVDPGVSDLGSGSDGGGGFYGSQKALPAGNWSSAAAPTVWSSPAAVGNGSGGGGYSSSAVGNGSGGGGYSSPRSNRRGLFARLFCRRR